MTNDYISRKQAIDACHNFAIGVLDDYYEKCLKQWIIDLPSITPQEPFINKICVSSEVCEHDKNKVLNKIYAEIEELQRDMLYASKVEFNDIYKILDKYKAESEDKE